MRNLLVILLLVMFAGSHSIANWVNPLHNETGIVPVSKNLNFPENRTINVVSSTAIDVEHSSCGPADMSLTPANAVHCAADCGLSGRSVMVGSNGSLIELLLLHEQPVDFTTANDHFRPPIA